jgi:DNA mismatch repair protein MutS2
LLSDSFYTLRDGRYVVPVRRDAHDRVQGIVHGESASGASIFVEPRAVVAHGNQLKMLESEHEREQRRLLGELSALLTERVPALRAAADSIDRLDLRNAAATLGRDLHGTVPDLSSTGEAHLVAARHPLLVLSGLRVVPSGIEIEAGHALVISGPNAGGKTVVLKTLGLCALMARAGLPLPVGEGSRIGFFGDVLCEMGDEQSTMTNLSTFSAHVRNLAALLQRAGPQSLVLLDEVATGTDPAEGAALAQAIVEAFCERGAALVATTHYEALKAASIADPRMRTASVGLDRERMEPTFELLLDVPGASSALTVARRFGLPAALVSRAEHLVPEQTKNFEQLVQNLHTEALALRTERSAVGTQREQLALQAQDLERRTAELAERSKQKLSKEAQRLMDELRQARSELDSARAALKRGERNDADVAAAQKALAHAAASVSVGSEVSAATAPAPKLPSAALLTNPEAWCWSRWAP